MEEQEKKKRIELEQDMSWKMYQILTITACTANLIGTICNLDRKSTRLNSSHSSQSRMPSSA